MPIIKLLLLLALPASGKSEIRRYLANLSAEMCREDFHMGPTVQLDDYPYVEFLIAAGRKAAELLKLDNLFFEHFDHQLRDPYEWGTLIEMVNEDHYCLRTGNWPRVEGSPAMHMFRRIDAAERRAGAKIKLGRLPLDVQEVLAEHLDDLAQRILDNQPRPETLDGKTIVIEFARGGPHGAAMPLDPPLGYQYSLSRLSPSILRDASILYVDIAPEQSRRKNAARAIPPPGREHETGIYHGASMRVMLGDYGCDDMPYLIAESDRIAPDGSPMVCVEAHGDPYYLPTAFFDNRTVDRTTFVRNDPSIWSGDDRLKLHAELKRCMAVLVAADDND